jgi:hypothetical protein
MADEDKHDDATPVADDNDDDEGGDKGDVGEGDADDITDDDGIDEAAKDPLTPRRRAATVAYRRARVRRARRWASSPSRVHPR